jgi:hypothetical protein
MFRVQIKSLGIFGITIYFLKIQKQGLGYFKYSKILYLD